MSIQRKEGWYWITSIEGGVFQPVYVRCDGGYMVDGIVVDKSDGYDNLLWHKANMPDESGRLKDGWYWVKRDGYDWHPAEYCAETSRWYSSRFTCLRTNELLIGERIERDD